MNVRIEGSWPESLTLRKGWARAVARAWNEDTPMAHLRIERGGASFIDDCYQSLRGLPGIAGVLSPPLPASARRIWNEAGFDLHAHLDLLRLELGKTAAPDHLVAVGDLPDLKEALRIDRAAFAEFWRFDRTSMLEALNSTKHSAIHVVRRPGKGLAGFAITGLGTAIAYLQRVAVDPSWQGRGIGRSLVRSSARWAERQGARALVLNTPADNREASGLYTSEGFLLLPDPLAVLGRFPEDSQPGSHTTGRVIPTERTS
jgi:ribosomal protein S18 acetylase RimI-like enzyme